MDLYSWIIKDKYLLDIFYTLLIGFICAVIVVKTDRFFRLSLHQGIRYFRNAFLFFGLAFITKYIFGLASDLSIGYSCLFGIIFEYLLVMSGFFIFYSLIWRKFESTDKGYVSSLFNPRILIFHAMALVIALLDFLFATYYFMFFSQIAIFLSASSIAYVNLKRSGEKHKFLKFYFFAMFLVLFAWILNFLAASLFNWNTLILINIGIMNLIFFLLFLFGVLKVTRK
jgi:hypothetical protein